MSERKTPKECFDHPVWECRECGHVFHEEPIPAQILKCGMSYVQRLAFCDVCGGDVERSRDRIMLAYSVRPVAPIKGQDYRMWRWCCWSCGKASEVAFGTRFFKWRSWPWNGFGKNVNIAWSIERCQVCGNENRLVYPEG